MNTKILFTFLSAILLSLSTYAFNDKTIVFNNIENTENGCIKEFLFCDKETNAPISKSVYNYDVNGRMLEKTTYKWDGTIGWVGIQKFEYKYGKNDQTATPSVKKWDKKNSRWME